MKKIERGSVEELVVLVIVCAVMGVILWPLLDLLISALFTHAEFVYTAEKYVFRPIAFGFIMGLILWLIEKNGFTISNRVKH